MQIPLPSRILPVSRWLLAGALLLCLVLHVHAQLAGWSDADLGSPSPPGSASESAGVLTVRGGGTDIWGTSDSFHFTSRMWTGDGDFVVRVASVENTNGYAKAGIMFRDGAGADAVNLLLAYTPQGLVQFQHRSAAGADTTFDANAWRDWRWLKLTRRGNVFTAYYDGYGSSWTQLGSPVTIAMGSTIAVGLAVTSHHDGVPCTATFDRVTPPGTPPPPAPARPTGLTANIAANGKVHLEWTDNSNNATRFEIYRTTGDSYAPPPMAPVTEYPHQIATVDASVHRFDENWYSNVDDAVYYWVRAVTDNPVPSNPPVYSDFSDIGDLTLPSWLSIRSVDLGSATPAGTLSYDGSQYTIGGGGAGFGGTTDSGHVYLNSTYYSEATVTARVTSLTYSDPGAMAGLMIRGYDSGSGTVPNAFVYVTPGGTVGFQYRHANGEDTKSVATAAVTLPVYLRLTRSGVRLTADYSTDGSTWTPLGAAFVNLSDGYEGFAVTSHRNGTLATATLDHFSSQPKIFFPAHWPAAGTPTNLVATVLNGSQVQLLWETPQDWEQSFAVERSTDGTNFAVVASGGTTGRGLYPQRSAIDYTVTAGTGYYYRVRSANPSGYSTASNIVSAVPNTATSMPATPMGLRATGTGIATEVLLDWSNVAGNPTGIEIERSSDGISFAKVAAVSGGAFQYYDEGLLPTTRYYYRLRAMKGTTASAYSPVLPGWSNSDATAPATPTNLSATAVSATQVDLHWTDNATNETTYAVQRMTNGIWGTITNSLPANTTSFSDRTTSAQKTYSYRVVAWNSSETSGYSAEVAVSTPASPPDGPPAWQSGDIGTVGAAGSDSGSGATATVTGSGADIWGTADAFHFRSEQFAGDGTITARVASITDTSGWAKAGLMFRESLSPSSRHAMMIVSVAHGSAFQVRATTNGAMTTSTEVDGIGPPRWVRLVRAGNVFTGYDSLDGITWTQRGTVTLASMPTTIYLGFAVTSHNQGVLTTAQFDNVSLTGTTTPPPPPPPTAPSNLVATAVSASRVDVTWSDNSTDETHFQLERSTNNTDFTPVGAVGPNMTQWSDPTVAAATTYYYRLYARNDELVSGYSNVASATTPAGPPPSASSVDVGTTTTGSTSDSGGRVTLTGSGRDIWNDADGFHFRYQPWTGDGEIIARIIGLTDTNPWAKAALMFRESLAATSRHATMISSIAHGTALQYRLVTGGESGSSAPTESGSPLRWLRLVRTGSTFTGYMSPDGVTWTTAGSVTIDLGATLYVGLAVTSHDDGVLCTATFENISLPGGTAPPPPPSPTPPNAPTNLVAAATSSSQINLTWSDNSTNETGFGIDRSTDNVSFSRIFTTSANATSYSDPGLAASTTYYYRLFALNSAGASTVSSTVSATTQTGSTPPPLNWLSSDVGDVNAAGSAAESGGTVTLTGSGADIWNAADEFRFRYVTWSGDGEIIARVTSLSDTNGWAKTGLMFRESLASNSRHAAMFVSVAHGTASQNRSATGGESATSAPSESGGAPRWLRLVRNGNTFTGYASLDGVNWTAAGAITLALPTVLNVGLAVTSHNDGTLCTATFTNVTVRSNASPGSVAAPDTLTATVVSLTEVDLAWRDNSANETAFRIERSTDGVNFNLLTVLGADQVHFRDSGLNSSTTYRYRVRAEAGGITSAYSNTASANTGSAPPPPPPTWFHGDIGSVGVAGSDDADTATSSITVRGSGADVWDNADGFRFVYRALTGDCLVEARIASLENTSSWAKVGVMIRESTAANARNVFACLTPAQGVFAQSRATAGGPTTIAAGPPAARAPFWVRLTRAGSTIVASSSPDGVSWSAIATINLDLGATVQVGFAVSAHDNTRLNTAVFAEPFTR